MLIGVELRACIHRSECVSICTVFWGKKAKGQGNGKLARWDPLLFTKSKIYETKFVTYPRQRLPLKSILVRSLISLIWWGLRWLWSSVQLGDNPACCCGIKRVDSNEFLINNILWKPNLTHRKMSYGFSGGLRGEMSKLPFPFFLFYFFMLFSTFSFSFSFPFLFSLPFPLLFFIF